MNKTWFFKIFIFTFTLSIFLGTFSNIALREINIFFALILLIIIIFIGVFFDLLGVAVVTDSVKHHHSRASKKLKGSKESILMYENKDKISNIFNDVIGDVCGILSGAIGAVVSIYFATKYKVDIFLLNLLIGSIIASITVGGKALGKSYAIKNHKKITIKTGYALSLFSHKKIKK